MDHKSVKFNEFNQKTDVWDNYIDRLKFCFEANGIMLDGAKRANFFTVCGAEVFETLLALITPRKASDVTFVEIETILTKHYSPKPNEISMSYKFYTRNQNTNENASEYIAQLRKISSKCNFMELERMLRDRLVCGMKDRRLQYELLKKDNLHYQDVIDAMLAAETAGKDYHMIHSSMGTENSSTSTNCAAATTTQSSSVEEMDINAVQTRSNTRLCFRCGDRHGGECRFINATCRFCKKRGHIEKICLVKKKSLKRNINFTNDEHTDTHLNGIYSINCETKVLPFVVEVSLENIPVVIQVDTGASFSLVNECTWKNIEHQNQHITLQPVNLTLRTWTDTPVILLGQAKLQAQYRDIKCSLNVIIAKGRGPNLLGRDWLGPLNIALNINVIANSDLVNIEKTILKYSNIFRDGLGTFRGDPVTIHLKPGATPKFFKARPVPYAIKARVEEEIDRLVAEGVLRPLSYSEWATPVVPIIKKSGDIRLCGDYRSTVNQATESDTYPMPTANEVFATVAGAKFFTTLDLDRAYTQVKVQDSTAKMLTLNTCKGLYSVHRLPFGVKACPGIFQRLMTALLAGVQGVAVLIDDIIVSGPTMLEMQPRLETVLDRIQKAGFRLNKSKCKFAQEKVEFLGFVINGEGIHPAPSKIEAVVKTPEPQNVQELQAFLGLYNFYERFIPHKATILEPLHRLLDKSQTWQWTQRERDAFNKAKQLLTFETTLVHYDLYKPLILTCDSSQYGVGAVLSHVMENGQERPIAMSSRTLNSHERRIAYRPGTEISNADSLSRWPLPVPDQEEQPLYEILLMAENLSDFPFTALEICSETKKDQTLSRVVHFLQSGWPNKVNDQMKLFLESNKIRHVTSAPYHPATNGLAERMVQTVKEKLRKMDGSWEIKIPNMLLGLRVTPCSKTNKSPSELLMNRRLRTVLDSLHPDSLQYKKVEGQIINNAQQKNRETNVGQKIMYRNYTNGPKWLPGQVFEKDGPSNYRVQTEDGAVLRRHIDQIIKVQNREKTSDIIGGNNNERSNAETEEDKIDQNEQNNDLGSGSEQESENDPIIEIPSAEKWEEMLGIPKSAEIETSGGKIRTKRNVHSKVPYSRPSCFNENND
ncbi:uncharacterized protein K02A2.6-like [Pararge aegeria]|uniref:uncharacterized protein K02A2.6-like n=1 Tax=Pararge aegeria TaxID=116150 RepID=UPI0019CFB091|nr:uncharacterized protein K02A2.6-like [Pararge aegeria]